MSLNLSDCVVLLPRPGERERGAARSQGSLTSEALDILLTDEGYRSQILAGSTRDGIANDFPRVGADVGIIKAMEGTGVAPNRFTTNALLGAAGDAKRADLVLRFWTQLLKVRPVVLLLTLQFIRHMQEATAVGFGRTAAVLPVQPALLVPTMLVTLLVCMCTNTL